jgi:hypothetical protein
MGKLSNWAAQVNHSAGDTWVTPLMAKPNGPVEWGFNGGWTRIKIMKAETFYQTVRNFPALSFIITFIAVISRFCRLATLFRFRDGISLAMAFDFVRVRFGRRTGFCRRHAGTARFHGGTGGFPG